MHATFNSAIRNLRAMRSSAATLSLHACTNVGTPSSRMRAAVAGERLPLNVATCTPACISNLMPCPSRTWNTFSASPRAPK